jgi:hypothetical protein
MKTQRRNGVKTLVAALAAGVLGTLAWECRVFSQEAPIVPPARRSVRTVNDPLKQRSATQNIVFGRIVEIDEHRLTLQVSGPDETAQSTTLQLTPDSQIVVEGRPVPLTRLPRNARVKVYLQEGDGGVLDRVVVLNEDDPAGDDADMPPTEETAPRVDTKVTRKVDLGATLGTATDGVAVVRLEKNSPLAKAGLHEGDRIRQVAGRNVLTPDSVYRVLNEFDGGAKVELVATRLDEEFTYSLILPDDHRRVLVDGVEQQPLASTADDYDATRGTADRGLLRRLRELEQRQVIQQRQIDYLYRALVATRDQLGYPALSPAFPAFIGPGDAVESETGRTGNDGTEEGDAVDPSPDRPTRRGRFEIENPDRDPPIFEPRQPAPNRSPRQSPRPNSTPEQPAPSPAPPRH